MKHQMIPLFALSMLDQPNEHTPADHGLPFACLRAGVVSDTRRWAGRFAANSKPFMSTACSSEVPIGSNRIFNQLFRDGCEREMNSRSAPDHIWQILELPNSIMSGVELNPSVGLETAVGSFQWFGIRKYSAHSVSQPTTERRPWAHL